MGPDKTGTTAIQKTLAANPGFLAQGNVVYSSGIGHNDKNLSLYFCDSDERSKELFGVKKSGCKESLDAYISALKERSDAGCFETLILSHEGLVHLNLVELSNLKNFLTELSNELSVVLYARSPESYAISAMCQLVKTGRRAQLLMPPILRYQEFLGRILTIFGRDKVAVRAFDPKLFPSGDVVLDFLSIPDLESLSSLSLEFFDFSFKGNPSFTGLGLRVGDRIVDILAGVHLKSSEFKTLFADELYQFKGEKIKLTPLQLKVVQARSESHSEFLAREFGVYFSNPSLLYKTDTSDYFCSKDVEDFAREIIEKRLPEHKLSKITILWRNIKCFVEDKFY